MAPRRSLMPQNMVTPCPSEIMVGKILDGNPFQVNIVCARVRARGDDLAVGAKIGLWAGFSLLSYFYLVAGAIAGCFVGLPLMLFARVFTSDAAYFVFPVCCAIGVVVGSCVIVRDASRAVHLELYVDDRHPDLQDHELCRTAHYYIS